VGGGVYRIRLEEDSCRGHEGGGVEEGPLHGAYSSRFLGVRRTQDSY